MIRPKILLAIENEKPRRELIDIILKQDKEIDELKEKLKELQKAKKKKFRLWAQAVHLNRSYSRKPGQKTGHPGIGRNIPGTIHRTVEESLRVCPDCRNPLNTPCDVLEHIQEDIVPAHTEVTLFKRYRYHCAHCHKKVTSLYHPEEIPNSKIGPHALIHMAILKYHHALPANKIVELFSDLMDFKVSKGAVYQALERMSGWLQVEKKEILKAIRKSPQIHMDETGWKINGKGHWLWTAVNQRFAYYQIEKSRGALVPKKIIPTDYGGVLITDFYSAYRNLPGRKQKCLVHLLREMRNCFENDQTFEFWIHHKKLKRIIGDALHLKERRALFSLPHFKQRAGQIQSRLWLWANRRYRNKRLKRLAKRFVTYWNDIFTFLEIPDVPFSNNLAERMILPNVIIRNRSYQNRTVSGAKAHEVFMSLIQTLKLRNENPASWLKTAYLRHRQGNPTPLLTP